MFGNCQTERLQFFLNHFSDDIEVLQTKGVHLYSKPDSQLVLELMSKADLVLTHKIRDGYPIEEFQTSYLKQHQSIRSKIVTFQNLYFTGYQPSSIFIKLNGQNLKGPLDGIHFEVILNSYLEEMDVKAATRNFLNIDSDAATAEIELSLKTFSNRDQEMDLKSQKFLAENFKKFKMFHTMNHPNVRTLYHYSEMLAQQIGIKKNKSIDLFSLDQRMALNEVSLPVHPSLQSIVDFEIDSVFRGLCSGGGSKYYNFELLVEAYYEIYEKVNLRCSEFDRRKL